MRVLDRGEVEIVIDQVRENRVDAARCKLKRRAARNQRQQIGVARCQRRPGFGLVPFDLGHRIDPPARPGHAGEQFGIIPAARLVVGNHVARLDPREIEHRGWHPPFVERTVRSAARRIGDCRDGRHRRQPNPRGSVAARGMTCLHGPMARLRRQCCGNAQRSAEEERGVEGCGIDQAHGGISRLVVRACRTLAARLQGLSPRLAPAPNAIMQRGTTPRWSSA